MISPERTKQIFVALRLHFTGSYDYVKYGGKINAKIKPQETYHIKRMVTKYKEETPMRDFFVSNMVQRQLQNGKIDAFIGNYATKESVEFHDQWLAWWNACSYNLKSDIGKFDSIKEMIAISDGDHPKVFQEFLDDNISYNTLACLMAAIGSLADYWEKNCDDTIMFGSHVRFLRKYSQLLPKDNKTIKEIIKFNEA